MLGRTHMAVGIAAALAVMRPQTPQSLLLTAGAAGIGAVMSDIDAKGSESYKGTSHALGLIVLAAVTVAAADLFSGLHLYTELFGRLGVYDFTVGEPGTNIRTAAALGFFVLLCLYGLFQKHRSFTHSLFACMLMTGSVYGFLPIAAPSFGLGMLSHIALDLLNRKKVRVFWPSKKGFSLGLCDSDGWLNTLFCIAGIAASAILIYEDVSIIIRH